jgi:hypothetical protein
MEGASKPRHGHGGQELFDSIAVCRSNCGSAGVRARQMVGEGLFPATKSAKRSVEATIDRDALCELYFASAFAIEYPWCAAKPLRRRQNVAFNCMLAMPTHRRASRRPARDRRTVSVVKSPFHLMRIGIGDVCSDIERSHHGVRAAAPPARHRSWTHPPVAGPDATALAGRCREGMTGRRCLLRNLGGGLRPP